MRTLFTTLILAFTLLVGSTAVAQDAPVDGDREAMLSTLRGIDTVPTAEAMQDRFPGGEALLLEIAKDTEQTLYVRKRATTLLSAYPTTETVRALESIASDDDRLRPYAVYTLARTFAENPTEQIVDKVAAYLDDSDLEVRKYTVRGLRWMRHDAARTALQKAAASDDAELRRLARRSLERWKPAAETTPER